MALRGPVEWLKQFLYPSAAESRTQNSYGAFATPSAGLCIGREHLCEQVVRSASAYKCVLLFGGRQAGKTTVLLRIAERYRPSVVQPTELNRVIVPVYVDLMRLPWNATPATVFDTIANAASLAVRAIVASVAHSAWRPLPDEVNDLDTFEANILALTRLTGNTEIRLLFLLDEAKRVIGGRFPRAFQDNLFSLMYGRGLASPYCQFVLAGAQDLYGFCEDDTSPIGSRAAKHCIENLTHGDLTAMIGTMHPSYDVTNTTTLGRGIFDLTGGHAGISAFFATHCGGNAVGDGSVLGDLAIAFRAHRGELFQIWLASLTPEARAVHDVLLRRAEIPFGEIDRILRTAQLPAFRAERACDELAYTGLAIRTAMSLVAANRVYFDIATRYLDLTEEGTAAQRDIWALVRDVELGLREFIRFCIRKRRNSDLETILTNVLGEPVLSSAKAMRSRPGAGASGDGNEPTLDLLHFLYLGQLVRLIKGNPIWQNAKKVVRDKQWLDDRIADIAPVRNDYAHFRPVGEAQSTRCRIACFDLLSVLRAHESSRD